MPHQSLYTAAQARELDRIAIDEFGVSGIGLMTRAGRGAVGCLREGWPGCDAVHVYCGTGNNGGDGFVAAAVARARGMRARAYQVGDPGKIKGDALLARERAAAEGVEITPFAPGDPPPTSGVIVDALLGTGLSGELRGDYAAAIDLINASGLPVVALDIPSGLCADSGSVLGRAVRARRTITFIGLKRGLLTGAAGEYCGEIILDTLEVPTAVYERVPADAFRLDWRQCLAAFPRRSANAHKGDCGHVLVLGGEDGMGGAPLLAAEAAGRCGAGLVSAATRPQHVAAFLARRPEVMVRGVEHGNELDGSPLLNSPELGGKSRGIESGGLLQRATVVAVGPGLGTTAWSEQLLHRALASKLPLVVDADALNLLAAGFGRDNIPGPDWILTPHPGEAARLLDCSTAQVQADRFAAVRELQQRFGGAIVLKGAGTLVCGGGDIFLCPHGNPGMASGGMGDVLTGVLAALRAQGMSAVDAACLGACLHGRAADIAAAEDGRDGLLASDLPPRLRGLLAEAGDGRK